MTTTDHPRETDIDTTDDVDVHATHAGHPVHAAIDIGASSGRVVAGWVAPDGLQIEEVHRFSNGAAVSGGLLRWNLTGLFDHVLVGLAELSRRFPTVVSVGIDTWAVDYGLLGADGALLAEPVSYRDPRHAAGVEKVHRIFGPAELYRSNGLQQLPFTTVYQLAVERHGPDWGKAERAVLLPDLLAYWLTDSLRTEQTNASTTGLLDAQTRDWSELARTLDLPSDLFPPLIEPGETIGTISPSVATRTGLAAGTPVIAVGSHDTASAVVGVPADGRRFGYVSCGTWSLVGVELDQPVLTEASRTANFTNEGGVDGRVRYLRNESGLWLLQESLRTWRSHGHHDDLATLLSAAAALPPGPVVDVNNPDFLAPGDMPARIRSACAAAGYPPPEDRPGLVRCIIDSLATAYARTIDAAEDLTGLQIDTIHIVGGGCQNTLLCQRTADLSGREVLAGPVEATAIGNLAVQARAVGTLPASLDELRAMLRERTPLTRYQPQPDHNPDTVGSQGLRQ